MSLKTGSAAFLASGMPALHGQAFQRISDYTRCVIASRAVGKWATGLLLESYATKGFHNKAKSCPWGPMAGFVLADPRFTKNPDRAKQRKALVKTVRDGATETPLFISDKRLQDLKGPLARIRQTGGAGRELTYRASDPVGKSMDFVLRKTSEAPGADGQELWAVLYASHEKRLSNIGRPVDNNTSNWPERLGALNQGSEDGLLPVMAMIDPACPAEVRGTYRAATTGDYDLFAVFPSRRGFSPKRLDRRMVPDSDRFRQGIETFSKYESRDRGNLTRRIDEIRQLINGAVRAVGYRGGDVVHHSDEAGRPLVTDIDFPFIAFVPGIKSPYCVESVDGFKQFIGLLRGQYVLSMNPGWFRQLGISVSSGGSYEV